MKKVLVIGDTILDHYVFGGVSRVNPEAPHSVVFDVLPKEEIKLGGAANVAANIRGICGNNVIIHYFGAVNEVVGDLLANFNIASPEDMEPQNILIKTRYVCDNHHLLRVDRGKKYNFDRTKINNNLYKCFCKNDYDLVVISDYDKGTIDENFAYFIVDSSKKILFDLKKRKNVPLNISDNVILKCNSTEFENEISEGMINFAFSVVKTKGKDGCDVYRKGLDNFSSYPAPKVASVADVVGAGDTFLAGMAAKYLDDGDWNADDMAKFAMLAAAEKVKHFGTYIVKKEDL